MSVSPQFLLIDGSYYMFYRYFAVEQWWKHSHPDEPLENPVENEAFMKTFRGVFIKKIKEIIKKGKANFFKKTVSNVEIKNITNNANIVKLKCLEKKK